MASQVCYGFYYGILGIHPPPPPLPEAFENHISLKGLRNDSIWRKRERLNNFLMICMNPYVCAGCFNIGQDPYTGLSEKQDGLKDTTQG